MQWESTWLPVLKLLWSVSLLSCIGSAMAQGVKILDAEEGDLSKWQISNSPDYYKGGYGQRALSIVNEGKDGGPCLAVDIDFREPGPNEICFITRQAPYEAPDGLSFSYKIAATQPEIALYALARTRWSSTQFFDYVFAEADRPVKCNTWHDVSLRRDAIKNIRNIWSLMQVKEMIALTFRFQDVAGVDVPFRVLIDDIEFHYDTKAASSYRPTRIRRPRNKTPHVLLIRNSGEGYYNFEEYLPTLASGVHFESYKFQGLHFPIWGLPDDLTGFDLVALVDADTYSLSDRQLFSLADSVYSGAGLLVAVGPNSVAKAFDKRGILERMIPVEAASEKTVRSDGSPAVHRVGPLEGMPQVQLMPPGPMQDLKPKRGADVCLQTPSGEPVLIVHRFGRGRVAVLNTYPDAARDLSNSLFGSANYPQLVQQVARWLLRLPGEPWKIVGDRPAPEAPLRIQWPQHNRTFRPDDTIELQIIPRIECRQARVSLVDGLGRTLKQTTAAVEGGGAGTPVDIHLDDLAEGDYTIRVQLENDGPTGDVVEEDFSVVPPLHLDDLFPVIAIASEGGGGHLLDEEGLVEEIQDLAEHGINTMAINALRRYRGSWDPVVGARRFLERLAQKRGMAIMYEYEHFSVVPRNAEPEVDVYAPEFDAAVRERLEPMAETANLCPRAWAVKTQDEPFANSHNIKVTPYSQAACQKRYGVPLPDPEAAAELEGPARGRYFRFLSDYVGRQFDEGYKIAREKSRGWRLLHTWCSPAYGASGVTSIEDPYRWATSADLLDFDIYPYFYPTSEKVRFVSVHFAMALHRNIADFYGRQFGFYVELDDRNWPFQKNPVEASSECALTALAEGVDYLNTFIYRVFGTGNMARPARWEHFGRTARGICRAGGWLHRTRRQPAQVAIYFPYAQWLTTARPYWPIYVCELARRGAGECDVIHEEVALARGLGSYKVLLMPQVEIIGRGAQEKLLGFLRDGGTIIADAVPTLDADGRPLTALQDAIGNSKPLGDKDWQARQVKVGKGRFVLVPPGLNDRYCRAVEGGDIPERDRLERWIAEEAIASGCRPAVAVSDPDVDAGLRVGDGAHALLVVINHHPGEKTVQVTIHDAGFRVGYACDAMTGKEMELSRSGSSARIKMTLPGRCGRLIGLLPGRPGNPKVQVPPTVTAGETLMIRIGAPGGTPLPVSVRVYRPDGRRSWRYSREIVAPPDGVTLRARLASNEVPGTWRVEAESIATGRVGEASFTVAASSGK